MSGNVYKTMVFRCYHVQLCKKNQIVIINQSINQSIYLANCATTKNECYNAM